MAVAAPDRLHFTGNDEADELIAHDPLALLIGFALDQQVPVQTAFAGPLKIKQRLGTLDARAARPGRGRGRLSREAGGAPLPRLDGRARPGPRARSSRTSTAATRRGSGREAPTRADLRKRIAALPGFGEMKVKALCAVLAKRFGVEVARELVPSHPTLGDVDSPEALEDYQAKKRAHKAKMRAERPG